MAPRRPRMGNAFPREGRVMRAASTIRYGSDPGVTFYTHVSDQYGPFHSKLINATVRAATHVLDGLLYHESDLQIAEHYTDTAGFHRSRIRSLSSASALRPGYATSSRRGSIQSRSPRIIRRWRKSSAVRSTRNTSGELG
jgi:Tn3 transposase DDE domain